MTNISWRDANSNDLEIEFDGPDAVDKNGTLQDGHRGRVKLQMRDTMASVAKFCDKPCPHTKKLKSQRNQLTTRR
jgi:hypothetical protein